MLFGGAPITSASIPIRMRASGLWLKKNNKYITDSTDVESTQSSVMLPKSHWHVWDPQGVTDGWALGEDVCRERWSLTCGFFSSFFVMLPCSTISYTGTPTVSILLRNHKGRVIVDEKGMGLRTSNPAIHKTHTINPQQRGFMHHFTCSRDSVWCGILCYNDNIRNVEELFAQMSIWIPWGRDRFSFMPFSFHRCSHWNSLQSDMSRGRLFAPYMIASVLGVWFFCMCRCNMQKWL